MFLRKLHSPLEWAICIEPRTSGSSVSLTASRKLFRKFTASADKPHLNPLHLVEIQAFVNIRDYCKQATNRRRWIIAVVLSVARRNLNPRTSPPTVCGRPSRVSSLPSLSLFVPNFQGNPMDQLNHLSICEFGSWCGRIRNRSFRTVCVFLMTRRP